jgi:hypothetical protein
MTSDAIETLPFISEDDVSTFEGWLRFQGIDLATLSLAEEAQVRDLFADGNRRRETMRCVGRMKLKAAAGEYRYAVAVREDSGLWLTLWVRRSPKGEFFVFQPRGDGDWNPHASLHADGTFHLKSWGRRTLPARTAQRPDSVRGCEPLGAYAGHGPKTVGAVCEPGDFTNIVEVPPGILGPRNGTVTVDLLEPGADPLRHPGALVLSQLFTDVAPHVLIRVFR